MRGKAARTLYGCFLQAGGAPREDDSSDAWVEENFRPVNVLSIPLPLWETRRAREAASALKVREIDWLAGDEVILLGRRVAEAMGYGDLDWFEHRIDGRVRFTLLPHPSGRNRLMNDPKIRKFTGRMLLTLLS